MATLEKIRRRAGLLVAVIIGLALLLFVVGDMLNSGQSLFTNSKYEIAKVGGKSISYEEFYKRIDNLIEINKLQSSSENLSEEVVDNIREVSWNYMIEEYVTQKEFEKLGLTVSSDELMDMVQGENPHPIVRQLFSNPQTGILDKSLVYKILQQILQDENSEQKTIWLFYENEILRQRKMTKYINLLSKGLYTNTLQSKRRALESGKTMDFDYIVQRFTSISDSSLKVTKKDIETYYNEHLYKYQQEESRDLKFITFEVVPSEDDFKAAEDWINSVKSEFEKTDDTKLFINYQSDVPYDNRNYKDGELPEVINDFMFKAAEGDVYGPYFEDGAYKLSRLAKIEFLPDSVHARHILLQVNRENFAQVLQLADSLKKLIDNGVDFAMLAQTNSSDGSAQEGGDLGWFHEGEMVKPFSDTCFYGKVGDVKIVRSQFGVHIVNIIAQSNDVKKVQVGTIVKKVEPSNETDQVYYSRASEFAGLNNTYEKYNQVVKSQNMYVQFAQGIKPLDKTVLDLQGARELVKWAYEADKHDVSDVKKFGEKYVVAILENVKEEGYADMNDIQAELEIEVRKQKKTEQLSGELSSKIKSAKSLNDISASLLIPIQTAASVRFSASSVPGLGFEPAVVATAFSLNKGEISEPIAGNNGVYVLSLTNVVEAANADMVVQREQMMLERNYVMRSNYSALEALKKHAGVVDNREKFF